MTKRRAPDAAVSRRAFLAGSAGLWISASLPRPLAAAEAAANSSPRALSADEWRTVESITARILPTDETPGAKEAGCVNFIDKALAAEDADALPLYRAALRELDRVCVAQRKARFAALAPERQDAVLRELETGALPGWSARDAAQEPFFATLRLHTILGFVADPRHGGNRNYVGWRLMGYPGSVHHLGGSTAEQVRGEQAFAPIWERRGENGHD